MVPYGASTDLSTTGSFVNYRVYHSSDGTSTVITYAVSSQYVFGNFAYEPRVQAVPDERHNPKAWARWMREFLMEHIKPRVEAFLNPPQLAFMRMAPIVARAGLLPQREWRMKLWKQAL